MKIFLVTQNFLPYKHSGVFRALSFARYLPESGINPIVITSSERKVATMPYPDSAEQVDVKVIKLPWVTQDKSKFWPVLALVQRFPIGWSLVRQHCLWRSAKKVACQVLENYYFSADIDGVLATSPDPISLLVGIEISNRLNIPLWVDLRDAWSYGWSAKYRSFIDFLLERRLERKILNKANIVIANTPLARKQLIKKLCINPEKVFVVYNGYDETAWVNIKEQRNVEKRDIFEIAYVGLTSSGENKLTFVDKIKKLIGIDYSPVSASSVSRSPIHLLQAIKKASLDNLEFKEKIVLRWIGPVDDATRAIFQQFEKDFQIELVGPVDEIESNSIMSSVDLLILLQVTMYINDENWCTAVPAKLFSYLRSGTRILAPVQVGDITEILGMFSGTRCTPVGDVDMLSTALLDEFVLWQHGIGEFQRSNEENKILNQFERRVTVRYLSSILHGYSK
jgi:glycosyltransferase involved in cell wall biosynthesis